MQQAIWPWPWPWTWYLNLELYLPTCPCACYLFSLPGFDPWLCLWFSEIMCHFSNKSLNPFFLTRKSASAITCMKHTCHLWSWVVFIVAFLRGMSRKSIDWICHTSSKYLTSKQFCVFAVWQWLFCLFCWTAKNRWCFVFTNEAFSLTLHRQYYLVFW